MRNAIFNASKSHESLEHRLKGILRKFKTKKKQGKKKQGKKQTRKAKSRRHHKQKTSMRGGRRITDTPEHPAIGKLENLRNRIKGFVEQFVEQIQGIKSQAEATEYEISVNGNIYEDAVRPDKKETVTNMLVDLERNLENFQYELDQLIEKTVGDGKDLTLATTTLDKMIEFIKEEQKHIIR